MTGSRESDKFPHVTWHFSPRCLKWRRIVLPELRILYLRREQLKKPKFRTFLTRHYTRVNIYFTSRNAVPGRKHCFWTQTWCGFEIGHGHLSLKSVSSCPSRTLAEDEWWERTLPSRGRWKGGLPMSHRSFAHLSYGRTLCRLNCYKRRERGGF